MMKVDDLVTSIAYFSIPLQILASLCMYPKLASMPRRLFILLILFAMFIFLCGTGHLLRSLGIQGDPFYMLNWATAFVSVVTALYLLPLVPSLMGAIERNLSELEESNRKLMTFMAFLCHEIRNPLFAITSTIDFIEDSQLTAEQERALSNIKQSTNLMLRLVNDVLDLSRLESGKLELEEINFDIREMMNNIAAITETQVQIKHDGAVQFRYRMDDNVPQFVCSDSCRILQIAFNLLSNATKYTERGFIDYSVSVVDFDEAVRNNLVDIDRPHKQSRRNTNDEADTRSDFSLSLLEAEEGNVRLPDTCVLKIQVKDTGVGIPPERLEQILVPYSQAKLSDYRKYGGTGLGLSILTKLADIMRGTLHIESKEGVGSQFTVYLPFRVPSLGNGSCDTNVLNIVDVIHPGQFPGVLPSDLEPSATASGLDNRPAQGLLDVANSVSSTEFKATKPSNSIKKNQLPKFSFPPGENVVLAVDDNELNLKLISKMLEHFNLEHRTAMHGKAAVDIMRMSRNMTGNQEAPNFSLILMDMQMPVMDGLEAIQTLRKDGLNIPIIALTANALDHHRDEALSAGATEFATKPILREVLYEKCRHHLVDCTT